MKRAYIIPSKESQRFINLCLLSLYGEAYSPREEYLILQLCKYSIENEISHLKKLKELIESGTVVVKMILSYVKRKQGKEYIKNSFSSLFKDLYIKKYNFDLNPKTILSELKNNSAIKEGKKIKHKEALNAEEAAKNPEVKAIISIRSKEIEEYCNLFLDRIFNTMTSLPYGLRFILKQIKSALLNLFPKSKPDEIWKVIGYYMGYRFIGNAISDPGNYDIVDSNFGTPIFLQKSVIVQKIFMNLFYTFELFPSNNELSFMNPWLQENHIKIIDYFTDLIDVPQPEDYLQVNQYMELTQKSKPMIIISLKELSFIYQTIKDSIESVILDKKDPIYQIMEEMGNDVPIIEDNNSIGKKDIQLQLENRFKGIMQDEVKPGQFMYSETKELIIHVFKIIPVNPGPQTLLSILKDSSKFAKDNNNKVLAKNIDKIFKNLEKLEELNLVSKKDKYTSLLKDVALEVANRGERREAQQKEISRLKAALKNVKKHQEYILAQIDDFEKYLDKCRKNSLAGSKLKSKPVKFTYKVLLKKKVILDSNVPDIAIGATKFFIYMPKVGTFEIEAKVAGQRADPVTIELESLLEHKENHIFKYELDQITLSVPETIFLLNKTFLS